MIWLTVHNPVASVYLLQQYDPHQLMRVCHIGEAQPVIRTSSNRIMEAKRTSYDKCDAARTFNPEPFKLAGQGCGIRLFPINFQRDHIVCFFDVLQQAQSFLLFNLALERPTCLIRRLFILNFDDVQPAVTAKPLLEFVNRLPVKCFFHFPNG